MGVPEYLLIRGRLDRAGGFAPRRCTSTTHVRAWPRGTSAEELDRLGAGPDPVLVEVVGDDGEVLQREIAEVRAEAVCEPGDARTFRARAYVGLHERASEVRVRRDDRVLWEAWIPGAPTVDVQLERVPRRGTARSTRTAVLALTYSPPADEELAHVTVVYRWGERGFRTVHVGPPQSTVEIPADGLPGGPACRFLVTYSNGLRGASAATDTFDWEPLAPQVTVIRPAPGEHVVAGVPVVLEGFAEDPQHPAAALEPRRLVWMIDDHVVATGPVTSLDELAAGHHDVTLVYRGEIEGEASVPVWVRKPEVPTADQWPDWDPIALH
ncbi:hypothetical protein [Cellulomonas sp. P24]|uniref:hypothetical protein n=1 Tax=Cellulomonas sp. P24 TaxID=2885206 RepID=UPI00216AC83D|nr:hypothetical protein [Cellulomonas sp. P24]MCR6492881.1 hypothetical protein [Cellulomonas sp. P24]